MELTATKLLRFVIQETFILMSVKEREKVNNNYDTLEVDELYGMISLRDHGQVTCTHSMSRKLGLMK